jgi:transglutaminase-like putative cysteine protease
MGRALVIVFKVLAVLVMIAAPLLGVWVASSLAAYANARVGWVVAAGLLLFPVLPLSWEGFAAWRRRRREKPKPRILTFGDRLVLRTLAINLLFLGLLVASTPKKVFVALSARGDWFLRDRHGAVADRVRRGAFRLAGGLEWLYEATHPNPYKKYESKTQLHPEKPAPSAQPQGASWPMPRDLDPIVTRMPADAQTSIDGVARYIAAREKDPAMRVKALHDWVADNIAYDGPAFRSGNIPLDDGDAQKVFARRLGVCAGYAQLMTALGKVTGDEIVYVVGNVRTLETPVDGLPHAWNAVKIAGTWYLLDATFDAGYLEGSTFHKKYSTDYLYTPPAVFGVSHFPDQKAWQLRDKPLSRGDFIRQPMMQPSFYARHMTLVSPDRSQVTVSGAVDVVLENPSTYLMVDYVPVTGGKGTNCEVTGLTRARCALPTGSWSVMLFGSDQRYGSYDYLGALDVNSR